MWFPDPLLDFVREHEGLVLTPYKDVAGYLTVGYGHRTTDSRVITKEEADRYLLSDLQIAQDGAVRLCPNLINDLPRLGALTDLVFNVGRDALDGEDPINPLDDSGLVKCLRAEDWPGAASRFVKWCHARVGGKLIEVRGIRQRREDAVKWIETGSWA